MLLGSLECEVITIFSQVHATHFFGKYHSVRQQSKKPASLGSARTLGLSRP